MCICLSDTTLPIEERLPCLKGIAVVTACLAAISLAVGVLAAATLLGVPVIGTLLVGTFVATLAVEILGSALVVAAILGLILALSTLCLRNSPNAVEEDAFISQTLTPKTDDWREKMRQKYGIGSSTV